MSNRREARNRKIVQMFIDLRAKGTPAEEAIQNIHTSKQNGEWCLSYSTIRMIIYNKNYGRKEHRAA